MGYKINMLTVGDMNAASSRLRCFFLGNSLKNLGIEVQFNGPFDGEDLLFVQKNITANILSHAQKVKALGGFVLYDIDDEGEGLAWLNIDPKVRADFLKICDLLSVNTPQRLELSSRMPEWSQIPYRFVMPEPIDYMPWAPKVNRKLDSWDASGCWFGNAINFKYSLPFIHELIKTVSLSRFDAITNGNAIPALSQAYPFIGYQHWVLTGFASLLQRYDFCILIHDSSQEGSQKSNNKMLTALALGVVPLVSHTEAYAQTANDIGMPELILKSPSDLIEKVSSKSFMMNARNKLFSEPCQVYLGQHSSKAIAEYFVQNLLEFTTQKNQAEMAGQDVVNFA